MLFGLRLRLLSGMFDFVWFILRKSIVVGGRFGEGVGVRKEGPLCEKIDL